MRRAVAALVLVLLSAGVVGCDVGEPVAPPVDPATRAVDPAPTEPTEHLEFGDTGAQPDPLPGGGSPVTTSAYRLRVAADGCTVRRSGRPGGLDVLAWLVSSRDGTDTDPRGGRTAFRPRLRGTGVVALVVLNETADGATVRQVSNTVRVRCG